MLRSWWSTTSVGTLKDGLNLTTLENFGQGGLGL